MADLQKFVDSLDHKNLGNDGMAVAIAAICAQTTLDERERCAKIAEECCMGMHMKDYPMTTSTYIAHMIRKTP